MEEEDVCMNKSKLLIMATIPAAAVIPSTVLAAENINIGIDSSNDKYAINSLLNADISALSNNTIVTSYQWYYVDGLKESEIIGATSSNFTVPMEASGKNVKVVATDIDGNKYESAEVSIPQLELEFAGKANIVGGSDGINNSDEPTFFTLPGDTLSVTEIDVRDIGPSEYNIPKEKVSYTYQWMYKVQSEDGGWVYSIIPGATGSTYVVPEDALQKNMEEIIVEITATVLDEVKSQRTDKVTVTTDVITTFMKKINAIIDKSQAQNKYVVPVDEIQQLDEIYQSFSQAAKKKVSNYDVLQKALDDIVLVNKVVEMIGKLESNANESTVYTARQAFDNLNLLQSSLIEDEVIARLVSAEALLSGDSQLSKVTNLILEDIVSLRSIDLSVSSMPIYVTKDGTKLNYDELVTKIDEIKEKVKNEQLAKEYSSLVLNHTIFKEAELDLKAVLSLLAKVEKIESTTIPQKKKTYALTADKAYNALSLRQKRLVTDDRIEIIKAGKNGLAPDSTPEEPANELASKINTFLDSVADKSAFENDLGLEQLAQEVKKLISEYNKSSKEEKLNVKNIDSLKSLETDIRAAQKVIINIIKLDEMEISDGITLKYNSLFKTTSSSFQKLTTKQRDLVGNADYILSGTLLEDEKLNDADAQAAVSSLVDSIALLPELTTYNEYSAVVKESTLQYKKIDSKYKKYVTNYYVLTDATKHVKSIDAFLIKMNQAMLEKSDERFLTKAKTIELSYLKLPAFQQQLIIGDEEVGYQAFKERLTNTLSVFSTKIQEVENDIQDLIVGGEYVKSFEEIRNLENAYKRLSSKERKEVQNGKILTTAISDMKKVQQFASNAQKNILKKPSTVVNDFKKLNSLQLSMVNKEFNDLYLAITDIFNNVEDQQQSALMLVDDINKLFDGGDYNEISNFEEEVNDLLSLYDSLDATNKKYVKNISKLNSAKRDLDKVNEVHTLEEAIDSELAREEFKRAYNKLNNKLAKLYNQLFGNPSL